MRVETALPSPIAGAGRFWDYLYPDPETYATASVGRLRNYDTGVITAPTFQSFGGGVDFNTQVRQGALAIAFGCGAGGAGVGRGAQFFPARVPLITSRSPAGNPTFNDLACWRLVWMCALFAAPQVTGEVTCACITNQGTPAWIAGLSDGFGFHFKSDGSVSFASVRGGALVETALTAGGFDVTLMHMYELRLTAATDTTDAALQVVIDNAPQVVPASQSSWAAGTALPNVQNVGGGPGFLPMLRMVSDSVNALYLHQFRGIAAPTQAGLL